VLASSAEKAVWLDRRVHSGRSSAKLAPLDSPKNPVHHDVLFDSQNPLLGALFCEKHARCSSRSSRDRPVGEAALLKKDHPQPCPSPNAMCEQRPTGPAPVRLVACHRPAPFLSSISSSSLINTDVIRPFLRCRDGLTCLQSFATTPRDAHPKSHAIQTCAPLQHLQIHGNSPSSGAVFVHPRVPHPDINDGLDPLSDSTIDTGRIDPEVPPLLPDTTNPQNHSVSPVLPQVLGFDFRLTRFWVAFMFLALGFVHDFVRA